MQSSSQRKESIPSSNQEVSLRNCPICCIINSEIKKILFNLLKKFEKQINHPNETPQKLYTQVGHLTDLKKFKDLINTMFFKRYPILGGNYQCEHRGLSKYFCDHLNCSPMKLDHISHKLTWERVKYNFHIDTISKQIRQFPQLIMPDIDFNLQDEIKEIGSIQLRKKNRKKQKMQQNEEQQPDAFFEAEQEYNKSGHKGPQFENFQLIEQPIVSPQDLSITPIKLPLSHKLKKSEQSPLSVFQQSQQDKPQQKKEKE